MKKSQFETLIREVIRETIRKVDGEYVVYPEKGGKRLGTHSTKAAAEKQLTAIHLNKEAVEIKYTNPNFKAEWEEAVRYPEFKEMGIERWIQTAQKGEPVPFSSIKDVLGNVDLNFDDLEEPKKQRFQASFQKGIIEMPIAVKFSDKDYDLVAGNTRLSGLVKNGINPKIWIIDLSDPDVPYGDKTPVDWEKRDWELYDENYADGKVNKNTLSYLNSITKKAPFNPPQYLYHLSLPENVDSILKTGLKPGKPQPGLHGGIIKGEEFSGVWLTPIDDIYEIVETHHLPERFYNGKILQINTSGLKEDRFSIGIEYNLMKTPFTKQEYLDRTEEIIYLDTIPPNAISTLQENYADGKVKGKSRPGRVKKAGASCKGSVTDLRAKAKKYGGEKGKMYHWCANMKGGKK
jgi:hypothetical protein